MEESSEQWDFEDFEHSSVVTDEWENCPVNVTIHVW